MSSSDPTKVTASVTMSVRDWHKIHMLMAHHIGYLVRENKVHKNTLKSYLRVDDRFKKALGVGDKFDLDILRLL